MFFSFASSACSCGYMSMQENFEKSTYVVKATILSLADTVQYDLYSQPIKPPFVYGYKPVIVIDRVYKGTIKKGSEITLVADYGMCNYFFGVGKTYIIFLYKTEQNKYETSVCVNNFSLDDREKASEFRKIKK